MTAESSENAAAMEIRCAEVGRYGEPVEFRYQQLQALAAEGWEIVGVVSANPNTDRLYLQRRRRKPCARCGRPSDSLTYYAHAGEPGRMICPACRQEENRAFAVEAARPVNLRPAAFAMGIGTLAGRVPAATNLGDAESVLRAVIDGCPCESLTGCDRCYPARAALESLADPGTVAAKHYREAAAFARKYSDKPEGVSANDWYYCRVAIESALLAAADRRSPRQKSPEPEKPSESHRGAAEERS